MYFAEEDFAVADAVSQLARERQVKPAQIALAWVMQAAGVTAPIVGATKTEQLRDLIAAASLKLTQEEVVTLEKPYRPHRILGRTGPPRKLLSAKS